MYRELLGAQLIEFNNEGFKVKTQDDGVRTFYFAECEGDCCGYNKIVTTLFLSEEELKRNPIITNIEIRDEDMNGSNIILTLFGEYKPMAKIDSFSYSESGYTYGACVNIVCNETGAIETLSVW